MMSADTQVSPVFAGRETELALLRDTYDSVRGGAAATVLLGGEAGGGKSRLVNEFIARIEGTGRVLVGGCLELSSAGLPYAPFTAALRQLTREIGTAAVGGLMPGGSARDLARLLPDLGPAPAESEPGTDRARLFEQVLTLLERLAAETPLILVIEDAHWADRSTRDLLVFLARNLRHGRVLLLVSYRSDDLHRTHPLRPVLAELNRVEGVTRLDLSRLSRAEVAGQLTGILGRPPEPALVANIYARSAGIPLFVEAIAGLAGEPGAGVPDSLRDWLLAGVHRMPEDTQEVLRYMSNNTGWIGHRLLAAVTGLDDRALDAAVRPAVDANILVSDGRGYAFRHALIREAVHEDLLPGEHGRLHRRYAEALEEFPELSPDRLPGVDLALHWFFAHDYEKALRAAWLAASEAAELLAYSEQVQMLERVLELWDRVPDAAELIGHDQVRVLELAVPAALACGEADRGLAFVRAALAELDEATAPDRVAMLLMWRARLKAIKGVPGELADLRLADKMSVGSPAVRARVLDRLTIALLLHHMDEEGRAAAAEAARLAHELGDELTEVDVTISLATITSREDGPYLEQAISVLREALGKAEALGAWQTTLRAHVNLSDLLERAGRSAEAVRVARAGWAKARQVGRARTNGPFLVANLAESLIALGRWDQADEVLDECLALNPAPSLHGFPLLHRCYLALARGDQAVAAHALDTFPPSFHADQATPQERLPHANLMIDWLRVQGAHGEALDWVDKVLAGNDNRARLLWPILISAIRCCAEVRTPELRARAETVRDAVAKAAAATQAEGPLMQAYATTFAADLARASGTLDLAAWDAAAAAWERLDRPYPLAQALLRGAEAAGGEEATVRLERARELAERLRARPLLREIEALARRVRPAHSGGPSQGTPGKAPLGLTARELEVLRLVAEGRSNKEIAAALVISAKTASVHVSNILAKLGVAGRGEAAATAYRLGLFDGGPRGQPPVE